MSVSFNSLVDLGQNVIAIKLEKCQCFTYKASTVFAECGLHVGGLRESVDEAHLAVKQRAGFHKIVYHLFSADLPVPGEGGKRESERKMNTSQLHAS